MPRKKSAGNPVWVALKPEIFYLRFKTFWLKWTFWKNTFGFYFAFVLTDWGNYNRGLWGRLKSIREKIRDRNKKMSTPKAFQSTDDVFKEFLSLNGFILQCFEQARHILLIFCSYEQLFWKTVTVFKPRDSNDKN